MIRDKNTILSAIKNYFPKLSDKYSITRIGIFGSVARNEANSESDIDIVVEMEPDLFKRSALKIELENLLESEVDLVRYSNKMNHNLKERIDREVLYVR